MDTPYPVPSPKASRANQSKKCAEASDSPKSRDVSVHVSVLCLGEQWILALDPAALYILVPALGVVGPNQGGLALARTVELDVLHFILKQKESEKEQKP